MTFLCLWHMCLFSYHFTFLCNSLPDPEKGLLEHTLQHTLCAWGRGPWGLAVARPMTGQANCRGLNHRGGSGLWSTLAHSPFPPGLGWGEVSVELLYLEPLSGPPG